MKTIGTLLAVSLLTINSARAFQDCYEVSGSMTAVSFVGAAVPFKTYVHAGSSSYSTSPSVFPTFTSAVFCFDPSIPFIAGYFGDFAPYSISVSALNNYVTAVINQPHVIYAFDTGTTVFYPATRTLTHGQPLSMTGGNTQLSDANLVHDSGAGALLSSCAGLPAVCNEYNNVFRYYPDLERFYLTLTISWDWSTITGTAVGVDVNTPSNSLGYMWYSFSFSGTRI